MPESNEFLNQLQTLAGSFNVPENSPMYPQVTKGFPEWRKAVDETYILNPEMKTSVALNDLYLNFRERSLPLVCAMLLRNDQLLRDEAPEDIQRHLIDAANHTYYYSQKALNLGAGIIAGGKNVPAVYLDAAKQSSQATFDFIKRVKLAGTPSHLSESVGTK